MSIPLEKKVPMLNDFHTYLFQDEWCFSESQEKDRQVLEDFPTVSRSIAACLYSIWRGYWSVQDAGFMYRCLPFTVTDLMAALRLISQIICMNMHIQLQYLNITNLG